MQSDTAAVPELAVVAGDLGEAYQNGTFLRHCLSDAIRRIKFYGSDLPEELRAVLVGTSIAQ